MELDQRDPMNQYSLQSLRELCDEYDDGRETMTEFTADQMKDLRNAAELALNSYNQKEQKNFNLEKVCKLNFIVSYFYMTFTAKNAETDECRVFRGGVDALSHKVYLCEVKETDDIGIPSDRVENHSPLIWYDASPKLYFDIFHALSVGLVHYL